MAPPGANKRARDDDDDDAGGSDEGWGAPAKKTKDDYDFFASKDAMLKAFHSGDKEKAKELLEYMAEHDLRGLWGGPMKDQMLTLILPMASEGCPNLLKSMLEAGADPNAFGVNGLSPIMVASSEGAGDCVDILLAANAKVEDTTEENSTALMFASIGGHKDVAKKLLAAVDNSNVDAQNDEGMSALAGAIAHKHLDIIELLLDVGGADINLATPEGATPLIIAVSIENPAIVALLLARGANTAAKIDGIPTLAFALKTRSVEMTKMLIVAGADFGDLDLGAGLEAEGNAPAVEPAVAMLLNASKAALADQAKAAEATLNAAKAELNERLLAERNLTARAWDLVSPLPGMAPTEKPTSAALAADPEAVLAPFEGHPQRFDFAKSLDELNAYKGKD